MADDRDPTVFPIDARTCSGRARATPRATSSAPPSRRRALAAGGLTLAGLTLAGLSLVGLALPAGRARAHELLASATPIDEIRIAKGARTMDLVRDGSVIGSYRIALGFAPEGDKERRGDGRTPEGSYRIIALNRQSRFHLSLRLDYPNAEDRARAAAAGVDPGGDIMIHGLALENRHLGPLASYKDWTEGCIAVSNEEIEEIVAMTPIGTPVVITP